MRHSQMARKDIKVLLEYMAKTNHSVRDVIILINITFGSMEIVK
ncbi:MAG: hypothetical protein IEMM0008_1857 [bacterium]|nr:MAG: hypothetical protein IEMM0008_1857 [bacterium]